MNSLKLKQLGRHNKPIAIYNINGYFDGIIQMLKTARKEKFMTEKSAEIVKIFENAEELIMYLEKYKPQEFEFSQFKKV